MFSFVGLNITKRRHRLGALTIQASTTLGAYSKAGLVKPGCLVTPKMERIANSKGRGKGEAKGQAQESSAGSAAKGASVSSAVSKGGSVGGAGKAGASGTLQKGSTSRKA